MPGFYDFFVSLKMTVISVNFRFTEAVALNSLNCLLSGYGSKTKTAAIKSSNFNYTIVYSLSEFQLTIFFFNSVSAHLYIFFFNEKTRNIVDIEKNEVI